MPQEGFDTAVHLDIECPVSNLHRKEVEQMDDRTTEEDQRDSIHHDYGSYLAGS
jgi:hypothetical protein